MFKINLEFDTSSLKKVYGEKFQDVTIKPFPIETYRCTTLLFNSIILHDCVIALLKSNNIVGSCVTNYYWSYSPCELVG